MKLPAATCPTCRMIRRFLLTLGLGGVLLWQIADVSIGHSGGTRVMDGALIVAVIVAALGIFLRLREVRARFHRRR